MKNQLRKFVVGLLAMAMVVSTITPAAFAAPSTTTDTEDNSEETSISSTEEINRTSAKIVASLDDSEEATEDSEAKSVVKDAVFNNYNDSTDVSDHSISSEEMDSATEEVLEENNMTGLVDVTYETDSDDNVTTVNVEMDNRISLAADELEEKSNVYNLTDEQAQNLLGLYAQYIQSLEEHADIYGVQVAYNTTKDTNANPIGSLLDIASIPETGADYDTMAGLVQIYYLATEFSAQAYGDQIKKVRNQALASLDDSMTDIQKYLALNDWLANYCNFAMASIMEDSAKMEAPEPTESDLYKKAYQCMYNMIQTQVHDGYYDALVDQYGEEQAEAIATAEAQSYMEDQTDDPNGNGSQQAASTADTIVGLWESTQVGALVGRSAVCFGYANAYAYLVQCAFPEVYVKDGGSIDTASDWKSYKELNYKLNADGTPETDENGDCVWSADSAAIIDEVKIIYQTESSMFGETGDFDSPHYWNAVKADGKWYYVDPCYTDIYIECMNRDRVETDGNMNHLYFMFSDTSARKLYDGYFSDIVTLYQDIATDTTYEDAWVAFIKSQTYQVGDRAYYLYDSTNMLEIMDQYGDYMKNTGSNSTTRSSTKAADDPYGDIFGDTELKVVYHDTTLADSDDSYVTLVDFNNGQIYDPSSNAMVDNDLIQSLYAEYTEAAEQYPSIAISTAYYDGKVYFSLSNCILSYDLESGKVDKLIEYNKVSGKRDMSVALGGMAFTMTDDETGANTITVENPPIADMTIKDDGKMYVSVATRYGYASGKAPYTDADGTSHGIIEDDRSFGYQFAETNYNPDYNTYYSSDDETNDNDEFMWSANIVGTIEMTHLTGTDHSYSDVTVPESCTEGEHTVSCCSECGLIQESSEESPAEGGDTEPSTEAQADESTGHGHTYVKYDETYYTKDSDGNRNTGTSYVCIDCGKSFDADELDNNKTDADTVYNDIAAGLELSGEKSETWIHSADYTEAALYRVPVKLKDHMFDCVWDNTTISTRTVADVDQAGNCVDGLTYTYTANVDGQNYTHEESVKPGTHTYSVEWTWADDCSTATAKLTCDRCGATAEETVTEDAQTITKSGYTAATCEEDGSISYKAKVTHDDVNYVSTKTLTIPATGHSYGDPVWEWVKADDGSYTATATFTCEKDDTHVEKRDATLTVETDESTGEQKYVATVEFNDTTYTDEHEKEVMITSQPGDYTGEIGTKATFTVVAEGNGLTYQWQYQNGGKTTWQNSSQSGCTTNTLTVPITEARDGQKYRCIVTDAGGNSITSSAATMHATAATPKITITSQPTNVSGAVGTKAVFTVEAEGNSELTYQWQYQNAGSTYWQKSSQNGSTTKTLTVSITAARDGQKYRCVISDVDGNTVTSDSAAIEVVEPTTTITITSNPVDYIGALGEKATFTVEATGEELTYQWQYQNAGKTVWQNSSQSGNQTATLTVPITAARDGQKYRCVISDAAGTTATSGEATLFVKTVDTQLEITGQPEDVSGAVGEQAAFTVEAAGEGLTYQWQYQNPGKSYWQNSSQSGNQTATLTVPITAARDGQKYRCIITDAAGNTATSDAATLTVVTKITITSQPVDFTGAVGDMATFTVEATGNSDLTYQWQYQNVGTSYWQNSSQSGNQTATLTVPITAARDGQKYRCVITDADGNTVASNEASIFVE